MINETTIISTLLSANSLTFDRKFMFQTVYWFMLMTALIIWYFSDFFLTRNQEFQYRSLQYSSTFALIYNCNILITVFNKFFRIEKLEVCQASCNIIQIFCRNTISEYIQVSSDIFYIKYFSYLISIFRRNSCLFEVSLKLIFNCLICSEVNQKSCRCVKNLNVM